MRNMATISKKKLCINKQRQLHIKINGDEILFKNKSYVCINSSGEEKHKNKPLQLSHNCWLAVFVLFFSWCVEWYFFHIFFKHNVHRSVKRIQMQQKRLKFHHFVLLHLFIHQNNCSDFFFNVHKNNSFFHVHWA